MSFFLMSLLITLLLIYPKKKKISINLLNYKLFLIMGANRSHRYYSPGKGLGLWPNTQSEDKSVSEDDKLRKK